MDYFGTSLDDHGHYLWELNEKTMRNTGISFRNLPFSPEQLTNNMLKGEVCFYQCNGFTVIGIAGSCKDTRGGTKSIFWVYKKITFDEMKNEILNHPMAKKIIDKFPFEVCWQF